MSTPIVVTYAQLIAFIAVLGYPTETEDESAQVLVLQGVKAEPVVPVDGATPYVSSDRVTLTKIDNVPDQYNDVFLVLTKRAGVGQVIAFRGTMDAGIVSSGGNPAGTSHLTFGQHLYVAGLHPKNGGRPAFRAMNETNRFWREDPDRPLDGVPQPDEPIFEAAVGDNNHWGNSVGRVGNASLGCLVLASKIDEHPWRLYHQILTDHLVRHPFVRITLWRGADLFAWRAASSDAWLPTLYPGTKGPHVARMQTLLGVLADGDWRGKTNTALLAFQKAHGLVADAICGPKTWAALVKADTGDRP